MPEISVVMPAYNAERYISRALESILSQTFEDFECIVINDGSTDSTRAIIERFAQRDGRIRLVSRENRGIVSSLNEGLKMAQGSLIARMDADDIALEDRFAIQAQFLKDHPDYTVVGGQALLIDPDDRPICILRVPTDHNEIDQRNLLKSTAIWHSAAMIRCDALKIAGGYLPEFPHAQDRDLWLRLGEFGKLANLDQLVLYYRMHPKSIGHSKRHIQKTCSWRAMRDAAERRGLSFDVPEPTGAHQESMQGVYEKWAWWALDGGNQQTARLYATKALAISPLDWRNWKLLISTLRGKH